MTDRELMQMVLDALESFESGTNGLYKGEFAEERKALRDRLAQPEPEPVAWVKFNQGEITHAELTDGSGCDFDLKSSGFVPLYTAPVHAIDMSEKRVHISDKHRHEEKNT